MIPMDSMDLDSVLINPPSIEKLDTVKANTQSHQNSWELKSPPPNPSTGGCLGKGPCHCVDPGAIVEETFNPGLPDLHKERDADLKQQRITGSQDPTEK